MHAAEREMYGPLEQHFRRAGLLVLREVTTAQGRVDVVAARVDWTAARERLSEATLASLATAPLARAYLRLPARGSIELGAWALTMGVTASTARGLARELSAIGLLVRDGRDVTRAKRLPRVTTEIICCEAKLDDWRRGLLQVHGHRFYADRAYLAVANLRTSAVDLELLAKRRVGLLRVDGVVVVQEKRAPRRRPAPSVGRLLLEERFWAHAIRPALSRSDVMGGLRATG
jgi:hypothetical protein